ncbi:MAG TPA: sigma-70 family RNA polymerase sigma factor [Mycobacteriales bacterium]|nr:sigma-70 family RNA polymerase sigma factor [Mycobacteriales bacterium]
MEGEPDRTLREAWLRSYPALVGALTALTGSRAEAEDATQEAFARAVTAWRSGVPDNPDAWLRTAAVNRARSRFRRRRRGQELSRLIPDPGPVPAPTPDRVDLLTALRHLPSAQREALVLHHLLDMPVEEISRDLRTPVGTVKARLSRGRAALAALLGEEPSTVDRPEVPHA